MDKTRFLHEFGARALRVLPPPPALRQDLPAVAAGVLLRPQPGGDFESLFGGTDVSRQPTAHRNRYVVLRFNFSVFGTRWRPWRNGSRNTAAWCCAPRWSATRTCSPSRRSGASSRPPGIKGGLNELFRYAGERGIPLYVLIDEYDNFANTILAHEGAEAYHSFTHGGGFFRSFSPPSRGDRVGQPPAACSSPACRRSPWTT